MMKRVIQFFLLIFVLACLFLVPQGARDGLPVEIDVAAAPDLEGVGLAPVAVSENGKYLVDDQGNPFFWMGDTAWNLTHRLTREEIEAYLDDRQDKGFNVILFRLPFRDLEGEPQNTNPYGQVPFQDKDITQPNEDYFELVDFVLDEMEEREMVAGLLPLWGSVVGGEFGYDITEDDILAYANWLSHRYLDRNNIIWISGGDTGKDNRWEILGSELKNADPQKLVTFHPGRKRLSSYHLYGDADWLDFHMIQTGHSPDLETNYTTIDEIYRESSKPVLNGEPAYEDIVDENRDRISPHQVRKAAYWSLLAGSFGHVYGHVEIFQFARAMEGQPDTWGANNPWTDSMDAPGIKQIALLTELMRSVPWHRFQPKQNLVASDNPAGPAHIRAAAMDDGSIAWIYFPENQEATIDLSQLQGSFGARWFDPATGEIQEIDNFEAISSVEFVPPFAEDALLMFGPPILQDQQDSNQQRGLILVFGSLLVLILFYLILRQIRSGIG